MDNSGPDGNGTKVAIITGGAGGIGKALARGLTAQGVRVAVMDRDGGAAEAFAKELAGNGAPTVCALPGDVSIEADCSAAVEQTIARFGRVDILINNAGIGPSSVRPDAERNLPSIQEITPALWARFFEINLHGSFMMTRAVLPHLLDRGWGRIINNTTSFFTMLRVLPYGATKAALESASAIWATELAGSGVTVNVVVPGGPTDTAFIADESGIERAGMLAPEVMAAPVCWLASPAADAVTGRRFIAANWDPALPPAEAAERAGAPIGWPELASNVVWPGGAP